MLFAGGARQDNQAGQVSMLVSEIAYISNSCPRVYAGNRIVATNISKEGSGLDAHWKPSVGDTPCVLPCRYRMCGGTISYYSGHVGVASSRCMAYMASSCGLVMTFRWRVEVIEVSG
jgi:hypothetical protein